MTVADRPTRFAADLLDSAAAEGAKQSRSAKQQLDHWARVGRAVTMHETASRSRVEAALAGTLPLKALTREEHLVANAELDALISERAQAVSLGAELNAEGFATVSLDENGDLMTYHPDGTVTPFV